MDNLHVILGSAAPKRRREQPSAEVDAWLERDADRPLVLVSLGTFLSARDDVLTVIAHGLRQLDVRVALATGSTEPSRLGPLPSDWLVGSYNGGWQWAASTGTDAQPWFRIFNPTLQAIRHDPDGAYVRRWVPELAGMSREMIHAPPPGAYVAPIVGHREARARALTAYRDASRTD